MLKVRSVRSNLKIYRLIRNKIVFSCLNVHQSFLNDKSPKVALEIKNKVIWSVCNDLRFLKIYHNCIKPYQNIKKPDKQHKITNKESTSLPNSSSSTVELTNYKNTNETHSNDIPTMHELFII